MEQIALIALGQSALLACAGAMIATGIARHNAVLLAIGVSLITLWWVIVLTIIVAVIALCVYNSITLNYATLSDTRDTV